MADTGDPNHKEALRRFQTILDQGQEFLTHNYVLLESIALLQARLGLDAATRFAVESSAFTVQWIDRELHDSGAKELKRLKQRRISLVDHMSFLVMKRRSVTTAFAFDSDFVSQGFHLFDT